MMQEMVNKLDRFIHEVIDYTRNIKATVERREINIGKLIDEVIQDLKFLEGWGKIKFTVKANLDEPFISDYARVSTIFRNLITNSIKYHDFNKQNPFINIEVSCSGGKKSIIISDNGQGIDIKFQEQVFDMFFRGTERSTGSGLGLYIVTEMVAKLDGELSLDSNIEKGTKITIAF
jgi:signal transduction histidine kinase